MSSYIPDKLRVEVAVRAFYRCEYCRRLESDSFLKFQVDHIISRKHNGPTISSNLALCCPICNNNKGSDIATLAGPGRELTRLFNPRTDNWFDHFEAINGVIYGKTIVGEATVTVLGLNDINSILERAELQEANLWP